MMEKNLQIQVYRGLAAVFVVLFHVTSELIDRHGYLIFQGIFSVGFSGVFVFFVLSGFIITLVHYKDIGQPDRALAYARKRFYRIYPIYWLILAFYIPGFFARISETVPWYYVIQNVTLLRITNHEPLNVVAWTLSHEIVFYFIFVVVILSARIGIVLMIAWFACIIANAALGLEMSPPYFLSRASGIDYGAFTAFFRLLLSPVNLLFGLGIASYFCYRHIKQSNYRESLSLVFFLVGILLFIYGSRRWLMETSTYNSDWMWTFPYFGASAFFLISSTSSRILDGFVGRSRTLLLLGDASYSVYLIHYGVIMATCAYIGLNPAVNIYLYFLILLAVPILLGVLCFYYMEHPMLSFFGKRELRRTVSV